MKWLLPLLLLSACAPRNSIVKPVEVDMPVVVYCKTTPIAEPRWNLAHLPKDAALTPTLQAAFADLYLSKGYIKELQAQINACS